MNNTTSVSTNGTGGRVYFDYTTASFFFNLELDLGGFVFLMLVFLLYRLCRKDKETLCTLTFY